MCIIILSKRNIKVPVVHHRLDKSFMINNIAIKFKILSMDAPNNPKSLENNVSNIYFCIDAKNDKRNIYCKI